jgi:hypothetical protein
VLFLREHVKHKRDRVPAKEGGTADSATTENDNSNAAAAYEVHVTKADGSQMTAILDKSYQVLTVESHADRQGPHGDHPD